MPPPLDEEDDELLELVELDEKLLLEELLFDDEEELLFEDEELLELEAWLGQRIGPPPAYVHPDGG